MIKVCMLAEKLPPEFTGSGKQAVYLSNALIKKKIQIIGLCSYPCDKPIVENTESFSIVRIRTSPRERIRSFEFTLKASIWLLINREKYDVLHAHGYCWAAIPAMLVAKFLGKKTIYKITLPGEDDPLALYNSRLGRIKNIFMPKFDAFVAISDRVLRIVKEYTGSSVKVFTIPNGVENKFCFNNTSNEEAKRTLYEKHGIKNNGKIISYVGIVEYRKGVDILAKAWPQIASEFPEACLFLVGPYGENTEFYQHLVETLKEYLNKKVFLTGNVENPQLYYRASDVFVFPSRNESFGNVLIEAMACGTACVATKIEGVTEDILTDGYDGLIVEQEDHEALADAVLTILRDPELRNRLAEKAVKTVNERFRMDRIAEKYIELYNDLLKI